MSGINGIGTFPLCGTFAADRFVGDLRFRPNAASAPTVLGGSLKGLYTVTYSATGKLVVQFTPTSFKFAIQPTIVVSSTCADITNTNRFWATLLGDWDNTNRRFTVQCVQSDVAFQVPSDANNWVQATIAIGTKDRH